MSTHRRVFCIFVGFLLAVSGCGEHITGHCQDLANEIALPPDMRKDYHPVLTPVTDVVAGCYCHIEDVAIVAVVAPGLAIVLVAAVVDWTYQHCVIL